MVDAATLLESDADLEINADRAAICRWVLTLDGELLQAFTDEGTAKCRKAEIESWRAKAKRIRPPKAAAPAAAPEPVEPLVPVPEITDGPSNNDNAA